MEPRNLQRVTGWSCCNMMKRAEWRVKAHLCAQIHLFSLLCEILDHWSLKESFTVLLVLCQKNKSISWDMTKQTTHFECWMTVFGFLLCFGSSCFTFCVVITGSCLDGNFLDLDNWFAQFHSYSPIHLIRQSPAGICTPHIALVLVSVFLIVFGIFWTV